MQHRVHLSPNITSQYRGSSQEERICIYNHNKQNMRLSITQVKFIFCHSFTFDGEPNYIRLRARYEFILVEIKLTKPFVISKHEKYM